MSQKNMIRNLKNTVPKRLYAQITSKRVAGLNIVFANEVTHYTLSKIRNCVTFKIYYFVSVAGLAVVCASQPVYLRTG